MLEKAKTAQQSERETQYIESEIKHAKEFQQRGQIITSLKIINDALLRYPKSPELLQIRERLSTDHERARREHQVSEEATAIEGALNRKDGPKVQETPDAVPRSFPLEGVFSRLDEGEPHRREGKEIHQLVGEGHRLRPPARSRKLNSFV